MTEMPDFDPTVFAASALHVSRNYGAFTILVTSAEHFGREHIVLLRGDMHHASNVLCRVQSSCITSTALNSADCDCIDQVEAALSLIALRGCGVLIYLDQEGRGHGLTTKIRALALKNAGLDTLEAVESLGLPADVREYSAVTVILDALGVLSINLLSNNQLKASGIRAAGVVVQKVVSLDALITRQAQRHVAAKRARYGSAARSGDGTDAV